MNSGYVIVRFGGHWEGLEYKNGDEEVICVERGKINYSDLLEEVYGVVEVGRSIYDCVLYSYVDFDGKRIGKLKLKNERDIERAFDGCDLPTVFVSLKRKNVLGSQSGHYQVENIASQHGCSGLSTINNEAGPSSPPPSLIQQHIERCPKSNLVEPDHISEPNDVYNDLNFGRDWGEYRYRDTDADEDGDEPCHNNDDNDVGGDDDPHTEDVGNEIIEGNNSFENDEERANFEEFCEWRRRRSEVFADNQNQIPSAQPYSHTHPNIHRNVRDEDNLDDNMHRITYATGIGWGVQGVPSHVSPNRDEPDTFVTSGGTLRLGATYMSKDELEMAAGMYHFENKVEYRVGRSDKSRYCLICKYATCPFRMRGYGKDGIWRVGKFEEHRGCELDLNQNVSIRVHSKVIGHYYSSRLLVENSSLVPRDMMAEMESHHGLKLSYNVALSAKHHAFGMIFGDNNKSFRMLPSYLHMLRLKNTGSVIGLQVDDTNTFQFVFFAFQASISGFLNNGRPVVVVDGTHLKGKYKGILFVAVTKDGNEQIFPLAVGIGDVESNTSWTWFLSKLREAYGCVQDLLIVSDQHPSIISSVNAVFPEATHALCTYHLQNKLAQFGQQVVAMYKNAAYSYRGEDYDRYLASIKTASENGEFAKLLRAGEDKWSRCKCRVRRYGFMTSNAAESFNNRLLWARKMPVCSVLECARTIMEKWFYERRSAANERDHELTEAAARRLGNAIERGLTMSVQCLSTTKFKVKDVVKSYLVDLAQRTCSCRKFEYELMPCSHAAAAIGKAKVNIYSFVAHYYTNDNLRQMWAGEVIPVPEPSEWSLPENVRVLQCHPPKNPRQAGRPRQSRVQSALEISGKRKSQVCSRCGGSGHNCAKCPISIAPFDESTVSVTEPGPSIQVRAKKKCGICRANDHTRRRCPLRPAE